MSYFKNIHFYYPSYSKTKSGIQGWVLLNSGWVYYFTIFEKYTDWKDVALLENQLDNEDIVALEKEIKAEFESRRRTTLLNEKVLRKLNAAMPG